MYKTGQRVRIKRGAQVKSLNPRLQRVVGRSHVVAVHRFFEHFSGDKEFDISEYPARITWVTANGQQCWTDIENVEFVADATNTESVEPKITEPKVRKRRMEKGPRKCGKCGHPGHNSRTCRS